MSDDETKQPVEETTDAEKKKDEEDVKEEEEEPEEPKTKDKEENLEEDKEVETKEEKANEDEPKKEEENDDEDEEDEEEEEADRKPKKEVTTTPKKEKDSEVPLYDQPLEMSGKRDRKKVERFVQEAKKEEVEPTGTGVALGDIPFIDAMITKMQADELKVLHRVAYSRPGSGTEIKKNLRKFNGFPFTQEDKKYQSKLSTVERIIMSELKKMLMILGLERSGVKGEIVERLMAFMLDPQDTGKKPPTSGKRGKGRGRPRKGHDKKRENNTSINDSGSDRSVSGESDSEEPEEEEPEEEEPEEEEQEQEEQEQEEEEEKPKKTPARKTPAKKAPVKRAASKKATPARRSRAAESDDSDSDDEPLAKKVKQPPSDAELKIMVKKILEGANLEEVTMKSVCRRVYDNYPDFDLTHKKVFIKETVKSIIS